VSITPHDEKYVADLAGVGEVSLRGTADLAFWKDQLSSEGLVPVEFHGRARVLLTATSARFKGFRFREASITVFASEITGKRREGLFLPQAFNSSRMFAWFERRLFATPYRHAKIEVDVNVPARAVVVAGGELVLEVRMGSADARGLILPAASREKMRNAPETWRGPIFIPRNQKNGRMPGQLFFARFEGQTETYPFAKKEDVVVSHPNSTWPAVRWLAESHFAPGEWAVRANARHARSKTYARSET
jgi:hypothetical protein